MLQESPHWPPPMPREEAVDIACSMFFKHLRSKIKDRVRSKLGRALMRSLNTTDRATIQIDEHYDTQMLVVNVNVQRRVRARVDEIFTGSEEMDFTIDPIVVADAINTLPEDIDLQTLADFLAAQFVSYRDNYSSEHVRIRDEEHPQGRPLEEEEIDQLEKSADAQCDKMRLLYRAMLQRRLVTPTSPKG